MYRVLACLATQHDYRLLILAIMICAVESFVALYVYWQVNKKRGYLNKIWLGVAGFGAGGSIWATHFLAMLAYDGGVPTAYEPVLTVASFFVACGLTTIGFMVSSKGGQSREAAGGVIIGLGIASMHFIGMDAVTIAGTIHWDFGYVTAAIGLGTLLTVTTIRALHEVDGIKAVVAGTALLVLGITTLHFTAMAAVTIVPDPSIAVVPASRFTGSSIALAILLITVLVLGAGFVASFQKSRAAEASAQKARELVNVTTDALVLARRGVIIEANRRANELSGVGDATLVGRNVFGDLLRNGPETPDDGISTFETELNAADGSAIPVQISHRPLRTASGGDDVYVITDLRPLMETTKHLRRTNAELRAREAEFGKQNALLQTAFNHMTQGLCMFDGEHRLVMCNRRYAEMYGLMLDQLKPGTPLADVIDMRIANGIYAGDSPQSYRQERLSANARDVDMVQQLNDGRFIAISLRLMPDGGDVSTHEDITDRRKMEDRLVYLAHHDPLTDLPNRLMLRQKLEQALGGSRRVDRSLAVLMLDLDRFKEINDTLGHVAGDAVLKTVAERLRKGVRKKSMVGHFGGDEFAIIEQILPGDDVEGLPRRIQALFDEPIEVNGNQVPVGSTVGVAVAPRDGTDPDELLKRAGNALHQAKVEAKGSYRFFEAELSAALKERRALEQDLQQALPSGQLELYYQPLVNLAEDKITGYEALMRWHHPTRGPVPPNVFIPLAEETGVITALTEWVLHEACAEAARWPADMKVAVNLSVPQFKARNLMHSIIGALAKTALAPQRLELEITESVMMNDEDSVFAIFRQLRHLGARIVLDDFGTGFSSLSYLLRFPFDKIKIDRSFINGLAEGGNSLVLVRSVIQMARGLGLEVTAEGIETKEQLDIVRAEGCTEIQGYYISKPRPAAEIQNRQLRLVTAQETAVA